MISSAKYSTKVKLTDYITPIIYFFWS